MQSDLRRLIVAISESIQSLRLRMHESNTVLIVNLKKLVTKSYVLGCNFIE